VYVPYPVGNGEQRFNAAGVVRAGGALLVDDADFTPEAVRERVIPLLTSSVRLAAMTEAARAGGVRDGAVRMTRLARTVLGDGARVGFGA
jgi:UDP-N-acetylglucosamine--N-acetylmuramyl-(pentapeptide) pyrophosphoryl-undecaprenol N-acetylglucosamine transferase